MAIVCDAIAEGGDDRAAVIEAFMNTKGRESPLGTYDIDLEGDTTLRLRRIQGRRRKLVFNKVIKAQALRSHRCRQPAAGPRARRRTPLDNSMESASIPVRPTRLRAEVVREYVSRFGLIVLLLILPVVYGIQDLQDDGDLGHLRHQHQGRPVQRRHLGADRSRLHARLRHHRAHQLRPRRPVHDRQLRRLRHDRHDRPDRRDRRPRPLLRAAADHPHLHGRSWHAQHDDRAGRIPPAAQRRSSRR